MIKEAEIIFKPKRPLSDEEFAKYLSLVRNIASFDPDNKYWKFNLIKALKNIKNDIELNEILIKLRKYVYLAEDNIVFIKNIFKKYKSQKTAIIDVDRRYNVIISTTMITDEALAKIDKYIFKLTENKYRLRSSFFVNKVIKILIDLGYNVLYDKEKINLLNKQLKCIISRYQGKISITTNYFDKFLLRELREVCTLIYYREKVILDENKNYLGTELIERRLPCLKVDFSKKSAYVPVGLFHRVIDFLNDLSIPYEVNIKEKQNINIPMKLNFKLYPHQEEAYRKWFQRKRGTIAIFTRGGKSFIALKAIYDLRKPSIIFVTTRELAATWRNYLIKYLGIREYDIGYLGEGIKKITQITISTYASGVKYIEDIKDKFEFVVFDEGHHLPADSFRKIALNIDALYRMVLTATPYRRDKNEVLIFSLCGGLVANIDYISLLKMRIVAPIEVFKTIYAVGPEEKLQKLLEVIEKHKDEQIIIFTQYLDTAEKLYLELLKKGYKVALITGEVSKYKRERFFNDFVKGLIKILVTTTVLDEGVTVPDAEVAIIYEGSGEERQMIQRIGRVLGYKPGKRAKIYEIVDISNPKEKVAYFRRRSVREYYRLDLVKKILKKLKEGNNQRVISDFY